MSDILRLLVRMFAIVFGFFAGCIAAGLAYAFLARLVVPEDFGRFSDLEMTVTLVVGVLGVAGLFARAVLALAAGVVRMGDQAVEPARMIAIHTACAIIGASVYWLLVGRSAGRWLPSERARAIGAKDSDS